MLTNSTEASNKKYESEPSEKGGALKSVFYDDNVVNPANNLVMQ